jgi:uncharacterized protein
MTFPELALVLFGICVAAGLVGALLGLGGGIVVVPVLTLLFHVDIRLAIGASIISVIATSSGAAAAYVRERITNLRVGMFLEVGTTLGAVTGAFLAGVVAASSLYIAFGAVLGYSAVRMLLRGRGRKHASGPASSPDAWADRMRLHSSYYDPGLGRDVDYQVRRTPLGLGLMYIAGLVSGLLGIGSGALKVPAMDLAMGLPMKVSAATSNFMIGVTAAASAGVYLLRGDIDPYIAGPVAAGVLVGATAGARLLPRLRSEAIRGVFVVVLLAVAVDMLVKGVL